MKKESLIRVSLGNSGLTPSGMGELGSNLYIGSAKTLYQVNLSNGTLTAIGNASITYRGFGATTSSLYAISESTYNLYSINAATGVATLIGPTGLGLAGAAVAMSAKAGALYATVDSGGGSILYSVSTSTGAAAMIGNTGLSQIGSMVYQNGLLYAGTEGGALYTLDPATGKPTFVANTGINPWGLGEPASTFSRLHAFSNGQDGAYPLAGLTKDRAGNLYGTASGGGLGYGTVYKLTYKGSGWTFGPLYEFQEGNDGAFPDAPVTIGPDGSLYGTANQGGPDGDGTVYRLRPPVTACRAALCPWSETQLYAFTGTGGDGYYPGHGGVVFDSAGNLYGTLTRGGAHNAGAAYELTPSGPPWTEKVIYSFQSATDGCTPYAGLIFDKSGNLYGTNYGCGFNGYGTVYHLSYSGSWTLGVLYAFQNGVGNPPDGANPYGGLIFDASGNAYGTTAHGGSGGGTVFELMPSNGGWNFTTIYDFPSSGYGPYGGLVIDAAGNLYGTTYSEGNYRSGTVFELTPSNGGWIYTDLYEFADGQDGAYPYGSLVLDAAGNLYGTASSGGNGLGTVFEVTPN